MNASRRFAAIVPPLAALASLLIFAIAPPACSQSTDLTANHAGLSVEWIQKTEGPASDFALGDGDGDGDIDLFVIDNSLLQFWRNNGRGEFEVQRTPICTFPVASVLAMDVDGDSRIDVVAAARTAVGGIAVLRGLGAGRFAVPEISLAGREYLKLVDCGIDADGSRKIIGSLNEPTLGFDVLVPERLACRVVATHPMDLAVHWIASGDFNHDRWTDVVISASNEDFRAPIHVLLGTRAGLQPAAEIPSLGTPFPPVPIDVDGDGNLDLVIGNGSNACVFIGDGTGRTWTEGGCLGPEAPSRRAFASDLNQDGRPELLVSRRENSAGMFLDEYQGAGDLRGSPPREYSYMFARENGTPVSAILSADLNGDGFRDLALRSDMQEGYFSVPGMIAVILARPDGTLGGIRFQPIPGHGFELAAARLQRGERPHLVFAGKPWISQDLGVFMTLLEDDGLQPPFRIGDGTAVRVADLNRDGRDDLIIGTESNRTEIRLTSSDGRPGDVSARVSGTIEDVGDVDRDQRPDLLVRRPDGSLDVVWGHPRNRFDRSDQIPRNPALLDWNDARERATLADIDGDGRKEVVQLRLHYSHREDGPRPPDTVTVHGVSGAGRVRLLGLSEIGPLLPPHNHYFQLRAANLDGLPGDELVVMIDPWGDSPCRLIVLHPVGAAGYALGSVSQFSGEGPAFLSLADLDGDGNLDAACTNNLDGFEGVVHVRWNDGHGNFAGNWARRIASAPARGIANGDFDGDGLPDLAIMAPRWESTSHIAFIFGRREGVSAPVHDATFATAPDAVASDLVIHDLSPNPARGEFSIRWSVPASGPASIDLLDVAGRRVRGAPVDSRGARDGEARFDGLERLPAGLYWVRLRQGNQTVTKRVALIR
jgi:hypothetical protein